MGRIFSLFLLMFTKCLVIEVIKTLSTVFFFVILIDFFFKSQFFQRYFHTGIECEGSLTCIAPVCYLNTQMSGPATINMGCTLLRPLMKINVSLITRLNRFNIQQTLHPRFNKLRRKDMDSDKTTAL